MAKVNQVVKSRKEQVCSGCGKIIPVGSPYKWISFNYGPTVVKCESCGFKPYETTSNEYLREVGRISYEFEESVESYETIEDLESLRDETQTELEGIRDELEEKKYNLPEQFQESGPGEIITERIDTLENVIDELSMIDFELEEEILEDFNTILDKVVELENLEDEDVEHLRQDYEIEEDVAQEVFTWTKEKVNERYQEWLEEVISEKLDSIKEELKDAVSNLE